MNKKDKAALRHQEDVALNKGLCWAGAAIVLELLLLLVKRYYLNFTTSSAEIKLANTLNGLFNGLHRILPILVVVFAVWAVFAAVKKRPAALPAVLAVVSLVLTVCIHVILMFHLNGVQMLFLLVPVLAGLALVYYIYQKEFFFTALSGCLSVLGLWFVRYRGGFSLESVLAVAAIAAVLVLIFLLKKNNGVMGKTEVLSKDAPYTLVLAAVAVALAALLIGMIMGETAAYYLIFAMIAWLFVQLVYFTVKLM